MTEEPFSNEIISFIFLDLSINNKERETILAKNTTYSSQSLCYQGFHLSGTFINSDNFLDFSKFELPEAAIQIVSRGVSTAGIKIK